MGGVRWTWRSKARLAGDELSSTPARSDYLISVPRIRVTSAFTAGR
jgi:hypothetical protein